MLFKALKHITCQGIDYAPGEIVPGAASFLNLKEMIEWRYIGYATEEEIAVYNAKVDESNQGETEQSDGTEQQKVTDEAAISDQKEKSSK